MHIIALFLSALVLFEGVFSLWVSLNEHKNRHNFKDTINTMCSCGFKPETTEHYLLRCKLYTDLRLDILNDIKKERLVNVLLFDSKNFTLDTNANIIRRATEFLRNVLIVLLKSIFLIFICCEHYMSQSSSVSCLV